MTHIQRFVSDKDLDEVSSENIWSQSEFKRTSMATDGLKLRWETDPDRCRTERNRENTEENKYQQQRFRPVQAKAKTWIWNISIITELVCEVEKTLK